jgi:hypothetical protein
MCRIAEMPADDIDEERVAFGGPDRSGVTDDPDDETGIQSCNPSPTAAASVPLTIATERAPPSRIGSVKARCTGASKPEMDSCVAMRVIRRALRR